MAGVALVGQEGTDLLLEELDRFRRHCFLGGDRSCRRRWQQRQDHQGYKEVKRHCPSVHAAITPRRPSGCGLLAEVFSLRAVSSTHGGLEATATPDPKLLSRMGPGLLGVGHDLIPGRLSFRCRWWRLRIQSYHSLTSEAEDFGIIELETKPHRFSRQAGQLRVPFPRHRNPKMISHHIA